MLINNSHFQQERQGIIGALKEENDRLLEKIRCTEDEDKDKRVDASAHEPEQ